MRTTLTLDPDVAAALAARASRSGQTWKRVVNDALRAGLEAERPAEAPPPYETPVHDPGAIAYRGIHGVHELLALVEGEDHR